MKNEYYIESQFPPKVSERITIKGVMYDILKVQGHRNGRGWILELSETKESPLLDENGCIPAKTPCPFYDGCGLRLDTCPSKNNLRERPMSCGAARLHVTIRSMKQ